MVHDRKNLGMSAGRTASSRQKYRVTTLKMVRAYHGTLMRELPCISSAEVFFSDLEKDSSWNAGYSSYTQMAN